MDDITKSVEAFLAVVLDLYNLQPPVSTSGCSTFSRTLLQMPRNSSHLGVKHDFMKQDLFFR